MIIMHFISGVKSGGVEQMLTNYTSRMNKLDNIKEYIVYQHIPSSVCLNKLMSAGNICIRIRSKRKHPVKNFIDTYKLIKKYNPDIIHAHMNLLNFIPLTVGFISGVKIRISHSHIASRNIRSKIAEMFFKELIVLTATDFWACGQKAGRYMYGNRSFKVIPNGIDTQKFIFNFKKRIDERKKLGIEKNEILIGNVGRLTKQKNQFFLVKILKNILITNKNYKLLIIGSGEEKQRIRKFVKDSRLCENVLFLDPVEQISNVYDALDLFLLPSLYEGLPVSAIEAQVSGLPTILSTGIDHSAKIIDTTKFVNINNLKQWVKTIYKCDLSSNRKMVLDDFDYYNVNKIYFKLYDLYKELLLNAKES